MQAVDLQVCCKVLAEKVANKKLSYSHDSMAGIACCEEKCFCGSLWWFVAQSGGPQLIVADASGRRLHTAGSPHHSKHHKQEQRISGQKAGSNFTARRILGGKDGAQYSAPSLIYPILWNYSQWLAMARRKTAVDDAPDNELRITLEDGVMDSALALSLSLSLLRPNDSLIFGHRSRRVWEGNQAGEHWERGFMNDHCCNWAAELRAGTASLPAYKQQDSCITMWTLCTSILIE